MPVGGYVKERATYLKNHGLYEQWREIYTKYVCLAEAGDIEALKRAIFFAWYQFSEPSWLSGIRDLPDDQTRIVVNLLEEYLAYPQEDLEFKQMLPYYMAVCSYYLERFYPLPNIQKVSTLIEDCGKPILLNTHWEYRGQMGEYWVGR